MAHGVVWPRTRRKVANWFCVRKICNVWVWLWILVAFMTRLWDELFLYPNLGYEEAQAMFWTRLASTSKIIRRLYVVYLWNCSHLFTNNIGSLRKDMQGLLKTLFFLTIWVPQHTQTCITVGTCSIFVVLNSIRSAFISYRLAIGHIYYKQWTDWLLFSHKLFVYLKLVTRRSNNKKVKPIMSCSCSPRFLIPVYLEASSPLMKKNKQQWQQQQQQHIKNTCLMQKESRTIDGDRPNDPCMTPWRSCTRPFRFFGLICLCGNKRVVRCHDEVWFSDISHSFVICFIVTLRWSQHHFFWNQHVLKGLEAP